MGNGLIKREELHDTLLQEIDKISTVTPNIGFGMNNVVRNNGKTNSSPKVTFSGKSIFNGFGKDGNCEDVTKWGVGNGTSVLDTTNKVFGNASIKVTTASTGNVYSRKSVNVDKTKYYCLSGYLKAGTTSAVYLRYSGDGISQAKYAPPVTVDKFTRTFIKLGPTELSALTDEVLVVDTWVNGQASTGLVYNQDGIMLEEITADQYNDANFVPSPYVDGYACLQNPYVEIKHNNLVRNGNCEEGVSWWTPYDATKVSLTIENAKFKMVDTNSIGGYGYSQRIKLKPNTDYYVKYNVIGTGRIAINDSTNTIHLYNTDGSGTFNSGDNTEVIFAMYNTSLLPATIYFDSIMLIEGTVAPTQYLPCTVERVVLQTMLADGDTATYENGKVSGLINWKHKTLFGKDYDWQYGNDSVGFKNIRILNPLNAMSGLVGDICTKYDGLNLLEAINTTIGKDMFAVDSSGYTYISIADTDTGWAETLNPNANEIKAFMNGWKALANSGARYTLWKSVVDDSLPSAQISSTITATTSTTITVSSSTGLSVGDTVASIRNGVKIVGATISAISGNVITVNNSTVMSIGDTFCKTDTDTNTSLLDYCKNNVALGYEGYQLHYKLAIPEPLTDITCSVKGDIPTIDVGDNYVFIDSGRILGETINPIYYATNTSYWVNAHDSVANIFNPFKYKTEVINNIYRNSVFDTDLWNLQSIYPSLTNGNQRAYIASDNFDASANYSADYKILATISPQIGNVECSYVYDIVDMLNKVQEAVNSRQAKDSALSDIVDSSLYEEFKKYTYLERGQFGCVRITLPTTTKKAIPVAVIRPNVITLKDNAGYGIDITKSCVFYVMTNKNSISFEMRYVGGNTTYMGYFNNNGVFANVDILLDCRGRV